MVRLRLAGQPVVHRERLQRKCSCNFPTAFYPWSVPIGLLRLTPGLSSPAGRGRQFMRAAAVSPSQGSDLEDFEKQQPLRAVIRINLNVNSSRSRKDHHFYPSLSHPHQKPQVQELGSKEKSAQQKGPKGCVLQIYKASAPKLNMIAERELYTTTEDRKSTFLQASSCSTHNASNLATISFFSLVSCSNSATVGPPSAFRTNLHPSPYVLCISIRTATRKTWDS